ncbi:MAG: Phenol hydroxylase [Rhodocyclaceae bacterium]|nr:MAG: Phenol hydroxylase [Rhodocyclaceae bacterium]
MAEADHLEVGRAVLIDPGLGPLRPARLGGEGDVAEHRHPRHQGVALKNDAAIQAGAFDLPAVHDDHAAAGFFEAGQNVQDGRLAAAGVTDDADELAALDPEVDVVENRRVLLAIGSRINLLQAFDAEEMLSHLDYSR